MKKSLFFGGLFRPDFLILGIAIILGILLVGGLTPFNFQNTPPSKGEFIAEPVTPAGGDKSLQLRPVKFKQCSGIVATDYLVDTSGSMRGKKITELKKGLITFTNKLGDNSVIAMQTYNETIPVDQYKDVIPFSYYKDVKTNVSKAINAMDAKGFTFTKDAFIKTKQRLDNAVPKYPTYKFSLIFISDGVPETAEGTLLNKQRFDPAQDPTEIAKAIKQSGIRIFTIAYVNTGDASSNNQLQTLMKNVASSPSDYYTAPDETKIGEILDLISVKLCTPFK